MRYNTSICHLFRPLNEAHAINMARSGMTDGADSVCYDLMCMPLAERTVDVFRRILKATPLPSIFCNYRNDLFLGGDDEARMDGLLKAAEAGAQYIDIMGDLYDPCPNELTDSPTAVLRQRREIDDVHSLGAKVIVSSHMKSQTLKCDEILACLRKQAEHGADVCKLVSGMPTVEAFNEGVLAMARLRETFDRPWIFLGSDRFARLHRLTGPAFGCFVEFGVHDYDPAENFDLQPTIRQFRDGLSALTWQY